MKRLHRIFHSSSEQASIAALIESDDTQKYTRGIMGQVQNFGTGHDADEETKRGQQMIFQGEKMIAQNEKMLKQIRFAISIAILALAVGVIGLIATFVLHYEP